MTIQEKGERRKRTLENEKVVVGLMEFYKTSIEEVNNSNKKNPFSVFVYMCSHLLINVCCS